MAGSAMNLSSANAYYAELGFDTLPLIPGTKRAGMKAWQSRPSSELWLGADSNSNIGIRCGGKSQVAVIDCDDKSKIGTAENIFRFISGLGFTMENFPIVKTASGNGRHIYLRAANLPPERNYAHISSWVGSGEFRFGPGAYVVAPPSIIKQRNRYELLVGDFAELPEIEFGDFLPILQPITEKLDEKPSYKGISRFAWWLLHGEIPASYPSRSEAEQALITSLVNSGHDFSSIERLFMLYPVTGKYQEKLHQNPDEAIRYLRLSYYSAVEWTANNISPGRQIAENAKDWALNRAWKGRTGTYDREVFLAHVQIAWECGKVVYAASSRDLADIANISHVAATNATNRLIDAGLLSLEEKAVASFANKYSLKKSFTLPQYNPVRECKGSFNFDINHEVFCYQGLGKSSKLILIALNDSPKTEKELVKITGKTLPTIKKWLKFMSKIVEMKTGEIISLVYQDAGLWHMVENPDLERVAEVLNVAGIQEQRKRIHQQQRESHRWSLERGRISGDSDIV